MKPCRHADYHASCRICYLAATRSDYAKLWGEPPPGPRGKIARFFYALFKYFRSGARRATGREQKRRLEICAGCEHKKENDSCKLCGCGLSVKASWESEACPIGKWNPKSTAPKKVQ